MYARKGDTLIVESISMFARNTNDLPELIETLKDKQVEFISIFCNSGQSVLFPLALSKYISSTPNSCINTFLPCCFLSGRRNCDISDLHN